jgi:hypothetical protein
MYLFLKPSCLAVGHIELPTQRTTEYLFPGVMQLGREAEKLIPIQSRYYVCRCTSLLAHALMYTHARSNINRMA